MFSLSAISHVKTARDLTLVHSARSVSRHDADKCLVDLLYLCPILATAILLPDTFQHLMHMVCLAAVKTLLYESSNSIVQTVAYWRIPAALALGNTLKGYSMSLNWPDRVISAQDGGADVFYSGNDIRNG